MNTNICLKIFFVLNVILWNVQFQVFAAEQPKIAILATGGTIAGSQPDPQQPRYHVAALSVTELVRAIPAVHNIAEISGEQVVNIASQNVTIEIWLKLARRIESLLNKDIDGIVITHGTDTLEETAYFLSLVISSEKPVVLTAAMRPANALGADGPANLFNAIALAAHPEARGRGPLVVMNDEIFAARDVRKTNTTRPDAFQGTDFGPIGVIHTGKAFFHGNHSIQHTQEERFSLEEINADDFPYVEIVYCYADSPGTMIDAAVAAGAQGIVIAGVGNGNASQKTLDAMIRARQKEVIIVRSSRVGSGIVDRYMEINDDAHGFVAAMDLSPQKARILLMLALLQTRDWKKIQQFFMQHCSSQNL